MFILVLSGTGSLDSLITGLMAMKMGKTVLASSMMLSGMTSTALTALVSSVNVLLSVSNFYMSDLFTFLEVCVSVLKQIF